ncbi:MAG TPA: hypothetical protein DCZ30_00230, partial [Clostridiales bacterium]|nr:hypothetical protein [Clostridiales bacterium]
MLKAMIGTDEITIREMTTSLNEQSVENALLEYVGRRAVKDIATAVMELAVDDNQIIAEIQNNMYKLVLNNNVPSFEEYDLKGTLAKVLIEKGFTVDDANECVDSMLATTVESNQTNKPSWIPEGFEYYTGDLDTGYVVRDKKGNEFTYMPATDEYISRYEISKGDDGVTPMSVPGRPAWTKITQDEAIKAAKSFAPNCNSDLIEDYEYWRKMCEFISNKIGKSLVYDDSTPIGAYYNNGGEVDTGENPAFMVYNIDCLAGNHWCITNEETGESFIVVCGGSY